MMTLFACAGPAMGMFVLAIILYSIVGIQTMWFIARRELPSARWWFLLGCVPFWPAIYLVIVAGGVVNAVRDYQYGRYARRSALNE